MSDQPDYTNPDKTIPFAGQELILRINERDNPASDVSFWLRDYLTSLSCLASQSPDAAVSGGNLADLLSPAESMAHMVCEALRHKATVILYALPAILIAMQFTAATGGAAC